jgi:hypothetical protein
VLRSQRFCFLLLLPVAVLTLLSLTPQPAAAQATRVTPQTSVATLAPLSGTPCTGAQQSFPVPDFGQTEHTATLTYTSTPVTSSLYFYALEAGVFPIVSDVAMNPQTIDIVNAAGYYPQLFVSVTCSVGASFTLFYSGSSATPFVVNGNILSSQVDKTLFFDAPSGVNQLSPLLIPPYGSSGGYLSFIFNGAAPHAGGTILVECEDNSGNEVPSFTYGLQAVGTVQTFPVPAIPCAYVRVQYVSGGASAAPIIVDYLFNPPGFPLAATAAAWSNANITGATTTSVKGTGGILQSVVVNTSAAGTVKLYDIGAAGCAGAPASGLFATITLLAASQPLTLTYNALTYNGICVVTSAAPDITVTYQ